ncbi:class I SAM-dependent methyltransferase [Algoriphagus sp. AK58]|uniref:class I SAM-dependent methyltransferase n=1 Tax=Algoriphagus sp. AK58 TaxID=1406877 RepID=UPI001650426E|nr:class I SAM-dependent methyltransferase [Algoriphagus sp. AK58]MBC6367630.1 SAM-dependent methyltransferase [Algoriphagus sp. AK58]
MNLSELNSAEFRQFVQDHLSEDPALLLFKYQGKVAFDLKMAVQQISARQKAAKKLPTWSANPNLIFPASISLEQSSSEETAKFKAEGQTGKVLVDLTGGFGVDLYHLSQGFDKGIYCERQPELFQITKHNLELLRPGKFEFKEGDGLDFLEKTEQHFDLIYADPARRGSGNQKLYKLQDCEPDVVSAWSQLRSKSDNILIKASPMLDLTQAWSELPEIQKITVVSVKNEVKELLLSWSKGKTEESRQIQVVDLGSSYPTFSFDTKEEEKALATLGEAEKYLVEPLSGILKAGAFSLFAERFGLKKLEKNSHLYTGNKIPPGIPGRVFEIFTEVSPKKQEIKSQFPSGKVNVICRNYSIGAEELKKKLGLKDGGEDFLIGTKTGSGFKVFWCRRVK